MKQIHTPPQDKDAEEAILCSLMTYEKDPKNIAFLGHDDFYFKNHGLIFHAIEILSKENKPSDIVTVCHKLDEMKYLEMIGGASFLATIIDSAPAAVNFTHYAQIVKDCATQRQVIHAAQKIVDAGMIKKTPAEELVGMAQSMMLGIKTTSRDDNIVNSNIYALDGMNYVDKLNEAVNPDRLKTGFSQFDSIANIMGPLLVVISARPGVGKTAFAMSIIRNMTRMENMVGVLSLEMPKEQLFLRHLAIETGINIARFNIASDKNGALTDKERLTSVRISEQISRLPLLIDDSPATIEDIERKCRIMAEKGVKGIFIDQLSKISGGNGKDTEKFTGWVNRIALLKKELNIPIFLLAQINRGISERVDKMPTLTDLKQTGALEEDADMVFFINRPGYYDDKIDKSVSEIHLAKHRNGAPWWHKRIKFNPATTYYSEDLQQQ